MNVSLTPWLLDFHTVQFSVSSGWLFFFFDLLLSFWLFEEVQCVYLRLHLGQKSGEAFKITFPCPLPVPEEERDPHKMRNFSGVMNMGLEPETGLFLQSLNTNLLSVYYVPEGCLE